MAGILTHEQKQLAFRLRERGWRLADIGRELRCSAPMIALMVCDGRLTTGVPDRWKPRPECLGIAEREEILVGIRAGESLTAIARRLERSRSTISRDVAANGGRAGYSAWRAHRRARDQARRPRPCRLGSGPLLDEVTRRLEQLWSPDEIAKSLALDFPNDPEMRVSHGARKVWTALGRQGVVVGRDRVARLMRVMGLAGATRAKRRWTTRAEPAAVRVPDLVHRNFTADRPDALLVADLTYVSTWSKVAYMAFITDVFSRRIVGWKASMSMRTSLVLDALEMASWGSQKRSTARPGVPLGRQVAIYLHCLHGAAGRTRRRRVFRHRRRQLRL